LASIADSFQQFLKMESQSSKESDSKETIKKAEVIESDVKVNEKAELEKNLLKQFENISSNCNQTCKYRPILVRLFFRFTDSTTLSMLRKTKMRTKSSSPIN
jgi:hypothetical protein